jgi:hypothetical protein
VELDHSKGMRESIKLVIGERTYVDILDYINVPFHCVRFHSVGHVIPDCVKGSIKKHLVPS